MLRGEHYVILIKKKTQHHAEDKQWNYNILICFTNKP